MRNGTGSQWSTYFLLLQTSLAAALSIDWSPSRRHAGATASRLLQRSNREVTKPATAAFRSPKRQRLDAAPDETELAKATADRPRNMAPHGQVRLHRDAEVTHRGRGQYQGPT